MLNIIIPNMDIHKEVVIIGNGPSGIVLSYLLAGNWPYFTGIGHPDKFLSAKLSHITKGHSIIQCDLSFLSEGLDGRSRNPVPLLMDALIRPCADMGLDIPSLVEWKFHPEHQVDHVVLGRGPPGGSWHVMDSNVLVLSTANWMELPGLPGVPVVSPYSRPSVAGVAKYYYDYVQKQNLSRFFQNNSLVTTVQPLQRLHSQSSETDDPETDKSYHSTTMWKVKGFDVTNNRKFSYTTHKIVLATGSSDLQNQLHIPGELSNPSWVKHELRSLKEALDKTISDEGSSEEVHDPVLIVGAGLCAADAVIATRNRSLPAIHVFRKKVAEIRNELSEKIYTEYHTVHKMMSDVDGNFPLYTALPEHRVTKISSDHTVHITGPNNTVLVHKVSVVGILIGAHPDLKFLPAEMALGTRPSQRIDQANPIAINPYTHRVINAPLGMYALGPLVGDNFVRMLPGGAVAITSHIYNEIKNMI